MHIMDYSDVPWRGKIRCANIAAGWRVSDNIRLAIRFTVLIIHRLQFFNPEVEFYIKLRPSYLKACEGTKEFDGMP